MTPPDSGEREVRRTSLAATTVQALRAEYEKRGLGEALALFDLAVAASDRDVACLPLSIAQRILAALDAVGTWRERDCIALADELRKVMPK